MVASIMEKIRIGLGYKALIAVPNHLTEQTAAEFLRFSLRRASSLRQSAILKNPTANASWAAWPPATMMQSSWDTAS